MPLPTAPSKLGNLLPPDEYKAKARPQKHAKKQATEGEQAEAGELSSMSGSTSVAPPSPLRSGSSTPSSIAP